jgi:anti-sigma28 factor (negative regulator of flagellin synthesis)
MRVSRPNPEPNPVSNSTAALRPAAANQVAEPVSSTPTDRAQLTNLSSYLASALSGSAAHVAKLAKLAAAVSSGQYQVDSQAVSGSIVQHAIEFGRSAYWALST